MSAECQESYRECMAARRARVEKVLAGAQPGDTHREFAERAGVTRQAIDQACYKTPHLRSNVTVSHGHRKMRRRFRLITSPK
jgi:hypothetical protein